MKIKSVYSDYVQKSLMFLYPLLGFKRGISVTPIKTYLSWYPHWSPENRKLCCLYHVRDDQDFINFINKVQEHKCFEQIIEMVGGKILIVFDMSRYKEGYDLVVKGKYSLLPANHKGMVLKFFKKQPHHYVYVDSYLFPKKYAPLYARLLINDPKDYNSLLNDILITGELCSPPDLEKETLISKAKPGQFELNMLYLSNNKNH